MESSSLKPAALAGALLAALLLVLAASSAAAQDSTTVQLGREYAESRGLLGTGGRGWRSAWGASIRLPLLTPAQLGGGLGDAAIEEGPLSGVVVGRGADGLARRVLPADLDPVSPLLPPDARGTELPGFLRDLVSTLHPTAPLLAASVYRSAGLAVLPRALAVVPPEGLALPAGAVEPGAAAWVERAPELDGQPFLGFSRVISTDSLLARQRNVAGTRVDVRAYLAARLVDVVLGDRARAREGWLWGWSEERRIWVPIARAQEQALLRAGSTSRMLLGVYQPGFVSFGPRTPHTRALTTRAWDLDRPWLALLDRATWDSVASALMQRLDDAALDSAVAALPAEHRALAGAEIGQALRVRRDALPKVVDEFYPLMTHYADLELTGLSDSLVAARTEGGALEIAIARGGDREPLRRFVPDETEEVRLHLGDGADRLVLEGVDRSGVGLRVTGGAGLDSVARPGPDASRVVLYDDRDGIALTPDDAARLVPHQAERQLRWTSTVSPPPPDWGTKRSPRALVGFNSDLGLYGGLGMQWKRYGFDERFYRQRYGVSLAYATKPSSFRGTAFFERRNVLNNLHLSADLLASGVEVVRFHGFGNETVDTADGSFYRAINEQYSLRLMLGFSSDPAVELRFGPVLSIQYTDTTQVNTLVAEQNPYGAGDFDVAGVEATFRYQPERSSFAPGLGVTVLATGQFFPAILDAVEPFGGVGAEVDLTWVPRLAGRLIVAARAGGSVLGGTVPFPRAARIGGPRTLRGYAVDRFAGDRGSAYGSLELRSRITRFRLGIAPGDLGVLVFGSGGRVWQSEESSGTVHWAGGGGLWIAPTLNWLPGLDGLVGRIEVAKSSEGTFFYFGTGFRF
jgi:hypothetical protein